MAEVLSASGYLALLDEPEQALRLYALQMLNQVVHQFWFEIAGSLAAVEAHYEDESFDHQSLAALVASKVRSLCFLQLRLVGPLASGGLHVFPMPASD